jgi:hypothetical protein
MFVFECSIYKKDKVPGDMKYELAQLALIRWIDS